MMSANDGRPDSLVMFVTKMEKLCWQHCQRLKTDVVKKNEDFCTCVEIKMLGNCRKGLLKLILIIKGVVIWGNLRNFIISIF